MVRSIFCFDDPGGDMLRKEEIQKLFFAACLVAEDPPIASQIGCVCRPIVTPRILVATAQQNHLQQSLIHEHLGLLSAFHSAARC